MPGETERRHLTVAFFDLVGSTFLSARMDPEDFRELIQSYQALCGRMIAELEGHIAQFLGDGILAYFGYPIAHEDDARRALEASLRITSELEKLDSGTDPLRIRIGIHTGEAVVGSLGGRGHEEQLALGETPNIAARLQSVAGENQILISDATWRLTRGHFQFEPLGPQQLKGISREITIYRLLGRVAQPQQLEAEHTARTPLTGRHRELEILESCWRNATRGNGGIICIGGEPGLGKSRLAAVLSAQAQQDSGSVLVCRCSPYHRASALYPFADLLARELNFQRREPNEQKRHKLRHCLADAGITDEDAAHLLDQLLTISDPAKPAPNLTPQRKVQITSEGICAVIEHRAASGPLLFVMEDLHWADPSSVELLEAFLDRTVRSPILAVLTFRPEFITPWDQRPNEILVSLKPLETEEAVSMVRRVAQGRQIPAAVIAKICSRTEGVPLFVEEVTKAVLESGLLSELNSNSEESGDVPVGLIPASVRDSLAARLDRLGEAREVLRMASVLGRDFSSKVLSVVADLPEEVLANALKKAEDTGLIYRSSSEADAHYIFKHALIQDAAYASLVRKSRRRYHERVARKLTEHFPETAAEQPEFIATHFDSAACHPEAAQYWLLAGERTATRGAIRETMSHLDAALSAIGHLWPDAAERYRLELAAQMQLMSARMAAFGWASNEVEESCLRAKELAIQLEDGARLFGSLWGLWAVYFLRGELREALDVSLQVFDMAKQVGTPAFELAGCHGVGYTRYFRGEFPDARRLAEEGIRVGSPDAVRETVQIFQLSSMACVRGFYSASLWMTGETTASARELRTNLEQVWELGHGPTLAQALAFALYIYHFWYDTKMIAATADTLLELSKREGYAMWIPMSQMFLAWCESAEAAPGSAQALNAARNALQGRNGLHGLRTELMFVQDMIICAETLRKAGLDSEARDALDQAIHKASLHSHGVMLPEAFRLRGEMWLESGEHNRAEADFREAMAVARRQSALSLELRAAHSMLKILAPQGREDEGRSLIDAISARFPSETDVSGAFGENFPAEFRYLRSTPTLTAAV